MGKVVRTIAKVGLVVGAFIVAGPQGAALAVAAISAVNSAGRLLGIGPKRGGGLNRATADRLFASIIPATPRKAIFGQTAMATDVRYQSYTGTDQEFYNQVVCAASHAVEAIDEIWLDDKQAWTATGGVQGQYVGYLDVTTRLEGTSANVISIDSNWGPSTNRRLTGCAYVYLRYKLKGTKKTESPFSTGIPTRMTIIGKGMKVYDPRRDSTVGGSGTMRADDQSTWAYSAGGVDIGRNAALCQLTWLLGWRINGKLAVGRGVPANRIDMAAYITAANLCAESVSLSGGGTEPRYRFDGIVGEDEDGTSVLTNFNNAMNGSSIDNGGKLALSILHNDLSAPVVAFDDDDILSAVDWRQTTPLTESRNVVRGRYVDPRTASLFQLVDYPESRIDSPDGIDRILTLDLPGVQSASQAQRLAKTALQRNQYGGVFRATFNAKAWGCNVGDPVTLTFTSLGFSNKLFRVAEREMTFDGRCEVTLTEENAAIYAWSAEEIAPVEPAVPVVYNYTLHPFWGVTRNADRGAWQSGVQYFEGEEVQDQNSTWGALIDHLSATGNRPPTLPTTENATWRLRSKVGDEGQSVTTIYRRSASAPATPSPSSDTPADWYAIVDDVPAGSGSIWMSVGKRASGATNFVWEAPLRQEGADGADGAYPPQAIIATLNPGPVTINYSNTIRVPAGGSQNVNGYVQTISNSNSGTLTVQIQVSVSGAGAWSVVASGSDTYFASEPVGFDLTGSFTNSSGGDRNYDVRVVLSTSGGSVSTDPAVSFFRVT